MSSMSYNTQSRLIRGTIAIVFGLLAIHFLYSMRERVTYIREITSAYNGPIKPDLGISAVKEPIPRKLWQTGKNGPASLRDDNRDNIKTWQKLNQNWRYEIFTDYSAETYVRSTFGKTRPEILDLYMDIRDPILRADFLRYLVLLGDGGVYSDMDTRCLKSIDDWVPQHLRANVSAVVGIEYDIMDGGRWGDWTRDLQITNWAMMSRPNHPMLERTVALLRERMYAAAEEKETTVSRLELEQLEVLDVTGPAMFTDAIFDHLSEVTNSNFTWMNLTKLESPLLLHDVLILPVTGFGNGQSHSNSQGDAEEDALVQHLFSASWKGSRPADIAKAEEEEAAKAEEEKKAKEEEEAKKAEEKKKAKEEEAAKKAAEAEIEATEDSADQEEEEQSEAKTMETKKTDQAQDNDAGQETH